MQIFSGSELKRASRTQGRTQNLCPGHIQCAHNSEGNKRLVLSDQHPAAAQRLTGGDFHPCVGTRAKSHIPLYEAQAPSSVHFWTECIPNLQLRP
jgi:hypothetical protein